MNKVVEVLRRERAELSAGASPAEDSPDAAGAFAERRRRLDEIDELLREFEPD